MDFGGAGGVECFFGGGDLAGIAAMSDDEHLAGFDFLFVLGDMVGMDAPAADSADQSADDHAGERAKGPAMTTPVPAIETTVAPPSRPITPPMPAPMAASFSELSPSLERSFHDVGFVFERGSDERDIGFGKAGGDELIDGDAGVGGIFVNGDNTFFGHDAACEWLVVRSSWFVTRMAEVKG